MIKDWSLSIRSLCAAMIFLFILFGFNSCTTRYYLVRHAEKECNNCETCGLTIPLGRDRAIALADSLTGKGIDNIFASQCLRTQRTAEPLADRINKAPTIYQTTQLNSLISTLKGFNDERDILIVGHSDQIPVIIDSLAHRIISIAEDDFANLYIITRKKFPVTSIRLESHTYGASTP